MSKYVIKKLEKDSFIEPIMENGVMLQPGIVISKAHDYLSVRPTAFYFAKKRNFDGIYALFYVDGQAWCDFLFTVSTNAKGKKVIEYCRACGVRGAHAHHDELTKIFNNWKEI